MSVSRHDKILATDWVRGGAIFTRRPLLPLVIGTRLTEELKLKKMGVCEVVVKGKI